MDCLQVCVFFLLTFRIPINHLFFSFQKDHFFCCKDSEPSDLDSSSVSQWDPQEEASVSGSGPSASSTPCKKMRSVSPIMVSPVLTYFTFALFSFKLIGNIVPAKPLYITPF